MSTDKKVCSVNGCKSPSRTRSLCRNHYARLVRHGDPLGGATSKGAVMRWLNEVALPYQGEGCLPWPFSQKGGGHGQVKMSGKIVSAHRFVCQAAHGEPPTSQHHAAHNCGNGHLGCVNPCHLEWKTPKENNADKLIHGTHNRGGQHPQAKLTEAQVKDIMTLKGLRTKASIAAEFGVSRAHISSIHSGRAWSWLREETL